MKKKKIRTGLTVLLALVFLVSAGMTVRQQLLYRKIAADSAEAVRIATRPRQSKPPSPTVRPEPDMPEEEPPEPLPEEAEALAELDLAALREINGDVIGWIEIPGIDLSYPLLQGTDNRYYLSRNWKRESSAAGAIFLDSAGSPDLRGFNTIIYGHRMRNDSMFGILRRYKEADFWQEHPSVYVVTEAGVHRYEIFAAWEAGIKGIVYRLDIAESGLEEEFIQSCLEGSVIDTGVTPEPGDRILTLSTCTGTGYAKRWVVQAVLRGVWTIE